jgi:replicative DNA helicase
MTPRIPPHDERAERVVLGLALLKPTGMDEIGDLAVDDFFIPAHRDVYEAMLELARRGRRIEPIGLSALLRAEGKLARLPDGEAYLGVILNAVEYGDTRHFVRMVAEKAVLRRMIIACAEIASACYEDVGDIAELVADSRQRLSKIELGGSEDGPVKLADDLDRVVGEIEKRATEPGSYFVLSHIEAFDRMIGGFGAGQLIVVAANPSRGKTAFGLNLILRAARNTRIPSLIFSLEMSRPELVERALAFDGKINGQSVVSGRMSGPEWMRIHSAESRLRKDPVWVDARMLSAARICSEARRWRAQNPAKQALIAIDYLGLIKRLGGAKEAFTELGEMSKSFKSLAKELACPVVLIAQLNRENVKENRKPRPSDLRGSGEIEADADMILFPWWEGEAPVVGTHEAWLIVAKNRKGPKGEVPVLWSPEFMSFEDRDDLEEPQQRSLA